MTMKLNASFLKGLIGIRASKPDSTVKLIESDPLWLELCELERQESQKQWEQACKDDYALRAWFELCSVLPAKP